MRAFPCSSAQALLDKFCGENAIGTMTINEDSEWMAWPINDGFQSACRLTELEAVRALCRQVGILCEL